MTEVSKQSWNYSTCFDAFCNIIKNKNTSKRGEYCGNSMQIAMIIILMTTAMTIITITIRVGGMHLENPSALIIAVDVQITCIRIYIKQWFGQLYV